MVKSNSHLSKMLKCVWPVLHSQSLRAEQLPAPKVLWSSFVPPCVCQAEDTGVEQLFSASLGEEIFDIIIILSSEQKKRDLAKNILLGGRVLRRLDAPRFSFLFTQGKERIVHFFSPQLLLEEKLVLSEKLRMAERRQHKAIESGGHRSPVY